MLVRRGLAPLCCHFLSPKWPKSGCLGNPFWKHKVFRLLVSCCSKSSRLPSVMRSGLLKVRRGVEASSRHKSRNKCAQDVGRPRLGRAWPQRASDLHSKYAHDRDVLQAVSISSLCQDEKRSKPDSSQPATLDQINK